MTPDQHRLLFDRFDQERPEMPTPADVEMAHEWEIYKLALQAIQYSAITEAVKKARAEREMAPVAPSPAIIRHIPFMTRIKANAMKIAAVMIFVISVGGVLAKFFVTTPASLASKYFTPYELGITRGGAVRDQLDMAYKAKDWTAVTAAFETRAPKTAKDYFLTGLAYLQLKNYTSANTLFNTLMQTNSTSTHPLFEDEAEFYAAMSYLANNQADKALPLLDKIEADPDHLYHRQVTEMSGLENLILHAK
jgi:tetratricopeptide (TPR) repeat protein